jgi:hypothetical protein
MRLADVRFANNLIGDVDAITLCVVGRGRLSHRISTQKRYPSKPLPFRPDILSR